MLGEKARAFIVLCARWNLDLFDGAIAERLAALLRARELIVHELALRPVLHAADAEDADAHVERPG